MDWKVVALMIVVASACVYDSECPNAQTCEDTVCYSSPRQLYQPCSLTTPCAPAFTCAQGRCYHSPRVSNEPCLMASDCAPGFQCEEVSSTCRSRIS